VRLQPPRLPLLAALGGDLPPARRLQGVDDADNDRGEQQESEPADDQCDHGDHLPMRCGRLRVEVDIIIEFLSQGWTPATVVAV